MDYCGGSRKFEERGAEYLMDFDDLDSDLVLALMELKAASSTELAHKLYNPRALYDLRKQDAKLRYRLKKLEKDEILTKNGTKYQINVERCFLTGANVELLIGSKLPIGTVLVLIPKNGDVSLRQVNISLDEEVNQKK